jgi:hypothetical protein
MAVLRCSQVTGVVLEKETILYQPSRSLTDSGWDQSSLPRMTSQTSRSVVLTHDPTITTTVRTNDSSLSRLQGGDAGQQVE